jgi:apolipoprotein N-acyltransferase
MHRLAGSVMLSSGFSRMLLTLAIGALSALALPPIGFFAILFVTLPALVWLLDGETGGLRWGRAGRSIACFRTGWLFGMGYFTAGLWWLGNALLLEADQFAWALPLAILGLPAVLALFYGLAAVLANILWSDGIGRIFALAAAFGICEWLRSFVGTGFPWNTLSYGFMPVPLLMQSAHLLGIFGMTLVTVIICAAPALMGTKQHAKAGLIIASLLFAAHVGYGAYRLSVDITGEGDDYTVRIVQPNIDQSRKMENADRTTIFTEHLRLTALPHSPSTGKPELVIWPETTVPFILTQQPDAFVEIAKVLDEGQTLLTGAVRLDDSIQGSEPRYYNSIYAIDDEGAILGAVDKVHLVPFGEYVPFEGVLRKLGVTNIISLPGGFTAAAKRSLLSLPNGISLFPLICYEIIFPGEFGDEIDGSTAILNVTNDGWFGNTPGPYQHLQQSRLRAVEAGKYVIRAANTGISAVIDPMGRIVAAFDNAQKGVIDTTVARYSAVDVSHDGKTWNFWLLVSLSLVIAVFFALRWPSRMN